MLPGQLPRAAQVARLARGAADWLIDQATGDPSLYHGLAGVVLALHEADKHLPACAPLRAGWRRRAIMITDDQGARRGGSGCAGAFRR